MKWSIPSIPHMIHSVIKDRSSMQIITLTCSRLGKGQADVSVIDLACPLCGAWHRTHGLPALGSWM